MSRPNAVALLAALTRRFRCDLRVSFCLAAWIDGDSGVSCNIKHPRSQWHIWDRVDNAEACRVVESLIKND